MSDIKYSEFIKSSTRVKDCPPADKNEYAFIGRSNVGKSSLINMLTGRKDLAKISGNPGKTQTINHFLMDKEWYLVDLPGYGYAKVSKTKREKWEVFIKSYLRERENLVNIFVLIDIRHEAQKIDLDFLYWLGTEGLPFSIVFTKADKLKKEEEAEKLASYKESLLEYWDELPLAFVSSSVNKRGKDEIIEYINGINK